MPRMIDSLNYCVFSPLHSGAQPPARGGRAKRGSKPGGSSPDRPAPPSTCTCPAPRLVNETVPCGSVTVPGTFPVAPDLYAAANADPELLADILHILQEAAPPPQAVPTLTCPAGPATSAAPAWLPAGFTPALMAQFMAWTQATMLVRFTRWALLTSNRAHFHPALLIVMRIMHMDTVWSVAVLQLYVRSLSEGLCTGF